MPLPLGREADWQAHWLSQESAGENPAECQQDYPAITENQLGIGTAYYIATRTTTGLLQAFFQHIFQRLHIQPAVNAPPEVEVVSRTQDGKEILFLLNHQNEQRTVSLDLPMTDLLTGERHDDHVRIAGYGVTILQK